MTDPTPSTGTSAPSGTEDLVDAMETGSDAGTPGERPGALEGEVVDDELIDAEDIDIEDIDTEDIALAEAAADDRPLPGSGGPQDDGLAPQFQEPEQRDQQ